jgi:hypothetical protein
MSGKDTTTFEAGLAGWFSKWRGLLSLFGSMVVLAAGGFFHISKIEASIDRLTVKLEDFDRRLPAVESASARDREAIVRMEIQIIHMNQILERIEDKIDQRHP